MTHLPDIRQQRRTFAQRLAVDVPRHARRAWLVLAAVAAALAVCALLVVTL